MKPPDEGWLKLLLIVSVTHVLPALSVGGRVYASHIEIHRAPGERLKIAHDIESAAEAASVTQYDIAAAIRSGKLVARRLNDRALILSTDLQTWVASLPEF